MVWLLSGTFLLQENDISLIFQFQKYSLFNSFLTNVPLMKKPDSWILLAKCLQNTCGRVTF